MIPKRQITSTDWLVQAPSPVERDFYAKRRQFVRNLPRYAKDSGLGKSVRILELIASRSKPSDPFCWVLLGTQDDWAKQCGLSRRTLQRWISELRSSGHLEATVRPSPALHGRRHEGREYPVFSVPEWLIEEVSRWADPGFWPDVRKRQNGAYRSDEPTVDGTVENPQIPVTAGEDETTVTDVTSRTNRRRSSTDTDTTGRTSRRLRQRGVPTMKRLSDDDYDPPVLGADPDRQSEPDPRRGTLTTQASELFVSAWKQMLADHPSVAMKVAAQPWLSGQKQWYMAWLKRQFLPAIDGDLERAEKIFSMFCRHLVEGSEFVPQNTSPFQRLHVRSDKYARLVPSAALPTVEEFRETGTSLRNNVVMGERPGRQNRRPRKPSQLPGVDLGDFLD